MKDFITAMGFAMMALTTSAFGSAIQSTFPNGVTLLVVPDPQSPIVATRVYVKAGSVDEPPLSGSGVSHYLEHLVAGGATTLQSEEAYTRAIARMGGAFNAYTTVDHTAYYINTTPEFTGEAIRVLYEWMFFSAFPQSAVDRERDVIHKEMEKNEASIPRRFYQLSQDVFYPENPLRYPVIGYQSAFDRLSRDDIVGYYHGFYVPSNMVVVVGGPVDPNAVREQVEKTFGSQIRVAAPNRPEYPGARLFTTVERTEFATTAVGHVSYRFETVRLSDPDVYPLDLLAAVLAQGNTSLLYEELVEKQKVAYSVDVTSYTPVTAGGYFEIQLTLDPKDADAAERALFTALDQVQAKPVAIARINRARQQQAASDILSLDTIEDHVARYGRSMIMTGISDFFPRYTEQLTQVTAAQVQNVARRYLDRRRMAVVRLYPESYESSLSQVPTPDRPVTIPELITLPNGARVVLYRDPAAPKVTAQWFVKGGLLAESASTNGIGTLVAQLVGKGSRQFSKDEIQTSFENKGAQLSAALGNQSLYAAYISLSEDVPTLFPIFLDAVLYPVFSDTELELARRQTMKRIDRRGDDWYTYADYQFRKAFFIDSPYRFSRSGEKESVSALKISDLDRYVKHNWVPQDMVLVVVGDFSRAQLLALITSSLGQFQGFGAPPTFSDQRPLHTQAGTTSGSVLQDVAALFIAYDGLRLLATPEELVLQDVVDAALSGMRYPGGLLHHALRSDGLVYLVHGTVFTGFQEGYFLVYALTSTDKMPMTETMIFEKIDQIKTALLEPVAFDEAIAQVRFAYRSAQASSQEFTTQLATDTLFGRGPLFYQTQLELLGSVTPDRVRQMAQRLFKNPQVYRFEGPSATHSNMR